MYYSNFIMGMQTLTQKKASIEEIAELKKEVYRLRSVVIGIVGEDEEGGYNPFFVKKILKAVQEPAKFIFKDKKSFLAHIKKK